MRDLMLIIHFIGLAMGLGTSFAALFLGIASAKMEKTEAQKFRMNTLALMRMGHTGITLLLLSGIYLIIPYWSNLSSMPLLITKLVLVLILGALIGMMSANARRAKDGEPEKYMPRLAILGRLGLLTSISIVILAVLVFH